MGDLKSYLYSLTSKRVAVAGAGISNTPLINLLLDAGMDITICDKRSRSELGESVVINYEKNGAKLRLGENYLAGLNEDVIFRTPGLMPSNPALSQAVSKGAALTSEMEVFFDLCPCKIIAVTGSDGKTTTTSIIAKLLENDGKTVHLGGNIGTPLLNKTDEIKPDDIAVVELSSFQLITMHKSPDIAVVTNLSPNHLDIHSDLNEYIDAKSNIFMYQKQSDRVVFNLDNDVTRNYAQDAPAGEVLFFSRNNKVENGVYCRDGMIYESRDNVDTEIMRSDDILLPGVHNIENYLAAFAAVSGIVSYDSMRKTAKTFTGVEHRIELVRELNGVKYYNDSIASSPSRAIAALKAFTEKEDSFIPKNRRHMILIAGGKDKGIEFDELGTEINARVKVLVLTGAAKNQIHDAVVSAVNHCSSDAGKALEIFMFDDFEDAVQTASGLAVSGDIVLLSPACTSFDRFKNFEERGKLYKDIVNRLV